MNNITVYLSEKLHLGKTSTVDLSLATTFGDGDVVTFVEAGYPFDDMLDKKFGKGSIDELNKKLSKYIKPTDEVYLIKSNGSNLSRCKELTEDFRQQIRGHSAKTQIFDYAPDASIKIYKFKNYNNKPEILLLQCQNWGSSADMGTFPITWWYVKL